MARLVLFVGTFAILVGSVGLPACSQTACDTDCSQETVAGGGGSPSGGHGGQAGSVVIDGSASCGFINRPLVNVPSATCTYPLAPKPSDDNRTSYDRISIYLDGQLLPRDISHAEGWDYADPTHESITVYGQACTDLTSGLIQTVSVSFVCLDV